MNLSRREILTRGVPALAGAMLLPGLGQAAEGQPAAPERPWPQRRQGLERAWLDLLGDFPTDIPPLRPIMRKVAVEGGITRYHVSFQSEADDRVTAWLLVPDSARAKPTAAIVCVYWTTFGSGKDNTIGLAGMRPGDPPHSSEQGAAYGRYLAQYGYVTLSVDLLTDGERVKPGARVMDTRDFYQRHPDWSMVGKNTWDIMRSVDFLQTLDFVDPRHIGCCGLSHGAHTALFAGAFEPRITATLSDGGVLDWHRDTPNWGRSDDQLLEPNLKSRFGYEPNVAPYVYLKKFRPYIQDPTKPIPVDFDGLMMMVAPRPLLIVSTEQEFAHHRLLPKCLAALQVYLNWRDTPGLPSIAALREACLGYDTMLKYYGFHHGVSPEKLRQQVSELGAGDCLSWFSFAGGHSFPARARRFSFAWLDRWLAHEPRAPWSGTAG